MSNLKETLLAGAIVLSPLSTEGSEDGDIINDPIDNQEYEAVLDGDIDFRTDEIGLPMQAEQSEAEENKVEEPFWVKAIMEELENQGKEGKVDVSLAIEALRDIVGLDELAGDLPKLLDLNSNGEVGVSDAIGVLRYIVGLGVEIYAPLEFKEGFTIVEENGNYFKKDLNSGEVSPLGWYIDEPCTYIGTEANGRLKANMIKMGDRMLIEELLDYGNTQFFIYKEHNYTLLGHYRDLYQTRVNLDRENEKLPIAEIDKRYQLIGSGDGKVYRIDQEGEKIEVDTEEEKKKEGPFFIILADKSGWQYLVSYSEGETYDVNQLYPHLPLINSAEFLTLEGGYTDTGLKALKRKLAKDVEIHNIHLPVLGTQSE